MRTSGISTGFPVLSRSSGQVPHVLLTRSPLGHPGKPGASLDLHVLSAPPAFVLSQDQTLHQDLDTAAGTEAPMTCLRSVESCRIGPLPVPTTTRRTRKRAAVLNRRRPPSANRGGRPHWLLAFTLPFSRSSCPRTDRGQRRPISSRADTHPGTTGSRPRRRQGRPCQSARSRTAENRRPQERDPSC
jgi:hypothetical protein